MVIETVLHVPRAQLTCNVHVLEIYSVTDGNLQVLLGSYNIIYLCLSKESYNYMYICSSVCYLTGYGPITCDYMKYVQRAIFSDWSIYMYVAVEKERFYLAILDS